MPKISVIIPVYNAAVHLLETLESVCHQTIADFEVLCIDDGSTDKSADIIKAASARDSRIRLISQPNAGPGAARNHGLELSQGDYVVFQDSDDLLHPETFALLLHAADTHHADVAICSFQSCKEDLSDARLDINLNCKSEVVTGDLARAFEDSRKFRGHPWGKLYRRETIGDTRFPDLHSGEDTYFNIDIAAKSKCMVILPIPLYIYRQVGSSLTHSAQHHANTIEAGRATGLHCIELYQQNKISKAALSLLIQRYATNAIMLHLILMMNNGNLSSSNKKKLFNIGRKAIYDIKTLTPNFLSVISKKYLLFYLLFIKTNFISGLWIINIFRSYLLCRI